MLNLCEVLDCRPALHTKNTVLYVIPENTDNRLGAARSFPRWAEMEYYHKRMMLKVLDML